MDCWAIRHGYGEDQIEYDCFITLIEILDAVFLDAKLNESNREIARAKSAKSPRRR